MAPAATIVQLQTYLRHGSQQRCHTVPGPPFTNFLHSTETLRRTTTRSQTSR